MLVYCPICHRKTFDYISFEDDCWGEYITVERHGFCSGCVYSVEQSYSDVYEGFVDLKRGHKSFGKYYPKDIERHKRNRRKHMTSFVKSLQSDTRTNKLLSMV